MAAGVTIKLKRKAGAFSGGELAAGELGLNTASERLEFSADGSTIVPVSAAIDISGTPTTGQAAQWTDANTLEGVDVVDFGGLSTKSPLVDNDDFLIRDSDASNAPKRTLWSAIKSTLKTYFDTLYQPVDSDLTTIAGLTATTNNFIVSVSSAWASRTPAQVLTTLGLSTSDSPQFTGVNIGHASDTTITRTGAGDIAVEGNALYRAGGTDVPLTDGGTGASTAAGARTNLAVSWIKAITVESPTNAEDISMFFTDEAITVVKMTAVLVGSSTPSVTWTIRHHTDRNNAGNEVVTSGTTTTSTTTGSVVTSFNDATIPADSFVWLETTAQSGTVGQIMISIEYTKD